MGQHPAAHAKTHVLRDRVSVPKVNFAHASKRPDVGFGQNRGPARKASVTMSSLAEGVKTAVLSALKLNVSMANSALVKAMISDA